MADDADWASEMEERVRQALIAQRRNKLFGEPRPVPGPREEEAK